jgi:hypothetical protein
MDGLDDTEKQRICLPGPVRRARFGALRSFLDVEIMGTLVSAEYLERLHSKGVWGYFRSLFNAWLPHLYY